MLYNLEPDRSVSGGAWYQDQDFEAEFVDVLNQQCLRFLQEKRKKAEERRDGPLAVRQLSCCSVKEVHKYISDVGISKVTSKVLNIKADFSYDPLQVNLDEDDLETILKTVVYDGKAERILVSDGAYVYRAIESPLPPAGLIQMPCGRCPVIKNCSKIGAVTPVKCQYMKDWLD